VNRPVVGEHGDGTDGEVSELPVVTTETALELARIAPGHRTSPHVDHGRAVVRMHGIEPAAVLVLSECLTDVHNPTQLLAHHLALGIVGPDDWYFGIRPRAT
jgi:hypothetical protein